MGEYYIGLMSGTSMDGIDAALVEFGESSLEVLQTHKHDYPQGLLTPLAQAKLDSRLRDPADVDALDRQVGESFRDAANALLAKAKVHPAEIAAIGSHGQTLRHEPNATNPYSLQVGSGTIIATGTGITTVNDFRSADVALGGQGAPLAPAFHEWLFRRAGVTRVVLNIGGIGNITVLPADASAATGYDTGPGNTLMDAWMREHNDQPFDPDGTWAASGTVNDALLHRLLDDPYFAAQPPKSTGFEHFNLDWLRAARIETMAAADVQATLCELTATTIADSVSLSAAADCEVLVCGGGVHNIELMRRLARGLSRCRIGTTAAAGLDPDWVEAAAFAWLAMRRLQDLPGNLPAVTGASAATVLGTIHTAG